MTIIRKKFVRYLMGLFVLMVVVFASLFLVLWQNDQRALSPLPISHGSASLANLK